MFKTKIINEVKNEQGLVIFTEDLSGVWYKYEYNEQGLQTYVECSSGWWERKEYNSQGLETRWRNCDSSWVEREYNEQGLETYWKSFDGSWGKIAYGSHGVVSHIDSKGRFSLIQRNDSGAILGSFHYFGGHRDYLESRIYDEKGIVNFSAEKLYRPGNDWSLEYDESGNVVSVMLTYRHNPIGIFQINKRDYEMRTENKRGYENEN